VNVVTEKAGHASAVLIRAVEPIQGIELRTQGPGLLCKAMHIDKKLNGHDLLSADFYIATDEQAEAFVLIKKSRIGVDYAKHWAKRLLRFYVKGNPYVSKT
jgi:DNA-3-methyladenine glycosylase